MNRNRRTRAGTDHVDETPELLEADIIPVALDRQIRDEEAGRAQARLAAGNLRARQDRAASLLSRRDACIDERIDLVTVLVGARLPVRVAVAGVDRFDQVPPGTASLVAHLLRSGLSVEQALAVSERAVHLTG